MENLTFENISRTPAIQFFKMATKLKDLAEGAGEPVFLHKCNSAVLLQKALINKKRKITLCIKQFVNDVESLQKKVNAETPTLPILLASSASSIKKGIRESTAEIASLWDDGKQLSEALLELDMGDIEVAQTMQEL